MAPWRDRAKSGAIFLALCLISGPVLAGSTKPLAPGPQIRTDPCAVILIAATGDEGFGHPLSEQATVRVPPQYPAAARRAKIEGCAVVMFDVEIDGSVSNLRLIGETPTGWGFGEAALEAFRGWRYAPRLEPHRDARYRIAFRLRPIEPGDRDVPSARHPSAP